MRLGYIVLFSSFLLTCVGAKKTPGVRFTDCYMDYGLRALCTEVAVDDITYKVYKIPRSGPVDLGDPVLFIAGGPGQAASEAYPSLHGYLNRLRKNHDILVVDVRGTGTSGGHKCGDPMDEILRAGRFYLPDLDMARVRSCRRDNPLTHTTSAIVHDLDKVRQSLGLSRWNLYGGSYGTRVVWEYIRYFPETVHAAIVEGVTSFDYLIGAAFQADADASLANLFSACAADAHCQEAYGDLKAKLAGLQQRFQASEQSVPLTFAGVPRKIQAGFREMAQAVFALLYMPEHRASLPYKIERAFTHQEYGPLFSAMYMDMGIYEGMYFSVVCQEDLPFMKDSSGSGENLFSFWVDDIRTYCSLWMDGAEPDPMSHKVHEAYDSRVPVLMLSGSDDPVTPPRYAESMRKHFPNSQHITFSGGGHNVVLYRCAQKIMADFLLDPAAKLDGSCAREFKPLPFFVNAAAYVEEDSR